MASKSMTCPALLLLLAMSLVVAAQSQLQFPCPPGCKGNINLIGTAPQKLVQDVERFTESVVDQAGDLQLQHIPCPLGCKGDIDVTDIDVQDMERWRERILEAIDLQNIQGSGLRRAAPVTRAAADVEDVADKKKA